MRHVSSARALELVEESLKKRAGEKKRVTYHIPSLWTLSKGRSKSIRVDPFSFFLDVVKNVRELKSPRKTDPTGGEWTRSAVIYNMFVRTTTAFDHDGNGTLDLGPGKAGFRETGTFLKAIALLPHIKRLGANTVHLLPVTAIGHDGNKGTLGSPYAIRNPYELDENLSEPALGLGVNVEFKAFVEAAHRMGLRVVVEFVFRTAAKDADWVLDHPEWFYWIKESVDVRNPHDMDESKYGSPIFTREELDCIHHDVSEHRFDNLLPPHQIYRDFFTPPPASSRIIKENGQYIGMLENGTRVRIPGAFADWPPDDSQPPWGDVTYLRMYTHPDFNYIAYNTIRMYDSRLTRFQHVNRPLWDKIVGIIPYYQKEFHIDGVMIDMGHALPMELKSEMVKAARAVDPDFAFWDENFSITRRSREEGYNAVFGFLWIDQHHPAKMRAFCRRAASEGFPITYFATPENHNTPRASARPGGSTYAKWTWVVNSFLTGAPFIHSGFELAETYPINTGLDFTPAELKQLPSEKLPLFSEYAYSWINPHHLVDWIVRVSEIRSKYGEMIVNQSPRTFHMMETDNEHVLAFARVSEDSRTRLAVVGSMNYAGIERVTLHVPTGHTRVKDLIGGGELAVHHGTISTSLEPGQCLMFEF